jgi:hypothetical protein
MSRLTLWISLVFASLLGGLTGFSSWDTAMACIYFSGMTLLLQFLWDMVSKEKA